MKAIVFTLAFFQFAACNAMGPSELNLNGTKYYKTSEEAQNNKVVSRYASSGGNSSSSIIITHILDKNNPSNIIKNLREKKSIEVVEVENFKGDHSDMMVTFVKFDLPNLKVQSNLCRIKRSENKNGSIVFQYVDTTKMKNKSEGAALPDFAVTAENMKQLPLDQYLTAYAGYSGTRGMADNIPWYKRPGARAGREYFN